MIKTWFKEEIITPFGCGALMMNMGSSSVKDHQIKFWFYVSLLMVCCVLGALYRLARRKKYVYPFYR